jgi:hypothetical protein
MNLQQIKEALAQGLTVHWVSTQYQVIKHKIFEDHYLIKCLHNNSCAPLEHKGKLSGDEKDYFISK